MATDNRKELGGTFDTAVSLYEKMRPGYVDELYKAIFDYVSIDGNSSVVEVGSGSGQATLPILKTGCALTAVEYGENFSTLLKDKYKEYSKFKVLTGKFEDVELEKELTISSSLPPRFTGYRKRSAIRKVYSMLKEGGAFARFANRPRNSKNDPELAEEIDAIYNDHYNKYYGVKPGTKAWFTEETAREISQIPGKYGFTDITYHLFHRERVFTAKEYIQLLGTYSDHIAIEESIRKVFFSRIEDAIHRHGGSITISDTLDLELARKPIR